jgi:hypothetical protein
MTSAPGHRAAAAQAARRHRQGAGRGRARAKSSSYTDREEPISRPARSNWPSPKRATRSRSRPCPLGGLGVRKLRQAQQEGLAGGLGAVSQIEDYSKLADTVASHLAIKIPEKQDMLRHRLGRSGWSKCSASWKRDFGSAGGKAHPLPRQAPDGEDPARVLSERADEGDPEGTRRRRGRPRRDGRTGREDRQDQALQGSPRKGDRRDSRSSSR